MTFPSLARIGALGLAVALLGAACSGSGGSVGSTAGTSGTPEPTESAGPSQLATDGTGGGTGILDAPWATAQLTDVRDGSTFSIADFEGQTIFVQNMAIWCINCRAQQNDAREALAQLPDDVVYIALDVDPNETAADLRAYADQNDFDWRYAVASPDVLRALESDFGPLVLSPPSTPLIVIGKDGTITRTLDGHKSVETLLSLAREHGAGA